MVARMVDNLSAETKAIEASVGKLKGTIDTLSVSGGKSGKSMSDLAAKHKTLENAASSLDNRLQKLSGTLESRLAAGLRAAKTGVELLTGAITGLGVKATLDFEAASTKIMTFAGVGRSAADDIT
ncbi:MAG: hypothetical protein ACYDD7_23635, partial [Acidimicrobiales bacterium]